jgi:hypothetical protein
MASDKLSTYKQTRDFEKTQEPSGQAKLRASNRRRFVIQKHDATRLHYDLRLVLDGVFKSLAVTKGPIRTVPTLPAKTNAWQDYCGQRSLEQAIKRLAKATRQAA